MQVATSSMLPSANGVIDLWWILHNKPGIVATFFFQRTTAFELVFIVRTFTTCSRQISCFRKTKAKTIKCMFASRLIWQLVITAALFLNTKLVGELAKTRSLPGFLAGVSFPPSSRAQTSLCLSFQTPATKASVKNGIDRNRTSLGASSPIIANVRLSCVFSRLPKMESFMLAG